MKNIICLLLILHFTVPVQAQDTVAVQFYDFIFNDSVVMYFNHRYDFTAEDCAKYRRFTKLDSAGNFTGAFMDSSDNSVLGKGVYVNGIKDGAFEIYHPNGILKSKGNYKDDRPAGYWKFYYPSGNQEKLVLFNAGDTLLLEYYSENGKQLVKDGNGHYRGTVGVSTDPYYSMVAEAEGNIVKGKPDGIWTSRMAAFPYCTEKFSNGMFVSGKRPKHLVKNKEDYFDYSMFNIICSPQYISRLEEFHLVACDPAFVNARKNPIVMDSKIQENSKPAYDLQSFRSYIMDAINEVMGKDIRSGESANYQFGDNILKISFNINEKGVPVDFKKLTSWGDQYFNPVTTAMSMHGKFPEGTGTLYLIITVTKDVSNYITSRMQLSRE